MSLEQTIGNLEIRYANVVTFVGTSNTMVDTTTGRIQTKGFQHNSNVITDISGPHGRVAPTLKKYPEIIFEEGKFDSNDTTNTYVQSGYTVTASTTYSTHRAFKAFNGVPNDFFHWQSGSFSNSDGTYSGGTQSFESTPGEWLKIEVPNKIKPASINLYRRDFDGQSPKDFKIYASITGSSWTLLTEQTGIDNWTNSAKSYNFDTGIYYKYFAILVTKITRTNSAGAQTSGTLGELELYGYEEYTPAGDHSVDTTFMSRFNNPQLTGVKVLVDGGMANPGTNQISGGADPSGNNSIYDATNKYYTLNGTLTSNLSVEANTFLEGDQPHAVSMWFNSSNLEANVSNTCVFSIASEEKLDSLNLDLQSNTWHNLTYAYQGEGGSRVTYLDGRKVAEDQAEDTFGDYPPFAMTGASQGGYVVSASSQYDTDYNPWEAFDNITDSSTGGPYYGYWSSTSGSFNTSSPYASTRSSAPYVTNVGGTSYTGEWLQIELPHKLKVDSINYQPRTTAGMARTGIVAGSNNDTTWEKIFTYQNITAANVTATTPLTPNSSISISAFKYIRIIITHGNGYQYAGAQDVQIYGHKEGDLTRFPDPTNVLKYPHVAMTGPAQRGYVVDQSNYSGYPADGYAWRAFDNSTTGYQSASVFSSGTASGSTPTTTATDTSTHQGVTITLQVPNKIRLNYIRIQSHTNYGRTPVSGTFLGSNNNTTWDIIEEFSGLTTTASGQIHNINVTNATSKPYYHYLRLVVKTIHTSAVFNGGGLLEFSELEYFGTEEGSVPIQIGGGNIDKVANFRVYDKFVGEDQALEIWDAQKDYFGRAKSQMVLQQGKLGVGTDAPQGRFSVADEPHNLEEFPPRAMTANNTYFEGHGTFKASSSSEYSATYTAFDAFDKITNNDVGVADNAWLSANNSLYASASDYAFTGSTTLGNGTVAGEWLRLELPYKIVLKSITLSPRPSSTNHLNSAPEDFKIYGSNDNINWTEVLSETGAAPALWTGTDFINVTSTTSYRYFAIVVQKTVGYTNYTAISGLKYFGTREQGQSVLHDGQLTLTKNLNVPRIGPALDADDTPRRDRLVVEYNTSTNPTFEGAVRDTSGRGNDGMFYGGASYDAGEKALVFDGTDDITEIDLGKEVFKNSSVHTTSLWVKMNVLSSDVKQFFSLGNGLPNPTGDLAHIQLYHSSNHGLRLSFTQHDYRLGDVVPVGQWVHVAYTYDGTTWQNSTTPTNVNIYINGTKVDITSVYQIGGGGGSALDLSIAKLGLGAATDGASQLFTHCDISNFKLYDTALTAEEVKTLYDMGRNGSVANPQPLHIAAPLYAPGTIVQVEQAVKTDTQTTTVVSPVDVTGLSVTIHPKFSNSKILVSYQVNMGGNYHMFLRVVRTQNGVATLVGTGDAAGNRPEATSYQSHFNLQDMRSMNIEILDSVNGTDAIEYKVQFWVTHTSYSSYINRSMSAGDNAYNAFLSSSITVKEVCQ